MVKSEREIRMSKQSAFYNDVHELKSFLQEDYKL